MDGKLILEEHEKETIVQIAMKVVASNNTGAPPPKEFNLLLEKEIEEHLSGFKKFEFNAEKPNGFGTLLQAYGLTFTPGFVLTVNPAGFTLIRYQSDRAKSGVNYFTSAMLNLVLQKN